jgi:UPF0716 protein FxsA
MTRRRFPWALVLLAFIGLPILEIYVIIQVGQVIGAWWTILLLIADSIFGSWLLRREGSKAWRALRIAISEGRMPAKELADGILVVIGGTLMISPGFVSDVFGILAILPFTRPIGRRLLARFLGRRLIGPLAGSRASFTADGTFREARRPGPSDDVVRGDVIDPETD